MRYFTEGIRVVPGYRQIVGMEIETMFVDDECGFPITFDQSQGILGDLVESGSWSLQEKKGDSITKICSASGDTISYELGRHNLEVAVAPVKSTMLIGKAQKILKELYQAAQNFVARPLFQPTFAWREDLLAIPDERDATFVELDGREALNVLASTACVQFMFTVDPAEAITVINNLLHCLPAFLKNYPQAKWWERYLHLSKARYRPERFGGPTLGFRDLEDYCEQLAVHDVITPSGLVPFDQAHDINLPLYLRSIWWYFRLRRFGDNLCVEIRPLPRREDAEFANQLYQATNAMEGRIVEKPPTRRQIFG